MYAVYPASAANRMNCVKINKEYSVTDADLYSFFSEKY